MFPFCFRGLDLKNSAHKLCAKSYRRRPPPFFFLVWNFPDSTWYLSILCRKSDVLKLSFQFIFIEELHTKILSDFVRSFVFCILCVRRTGRPKGRVESQSRRLGFFLGSITHLMVWVRPGRRAAHTTSFSLPPLEWLPQSTWTSLFVSIGSLQSCDFLINFLLGFLFFCFHFCDFLF